MKLYIRAVSLPKFLALFDDSYYLRRVLTRTNTNVYYIDVDDYTEIERLLKSRSINYKITDK